MSDELTGKSGKEWLYVVAMLVTLPLCYVLCIGPACVLLVRGIVPQPVFDGFYAPLEWSVPDGSPLGPPIKSYIKLWLNWNGTPKP